jgi:hypothetical protein
MIALSFSRYAVRNTPCPPLNWLTRINSLKTDWLAVKLLLALASTVILGFEFHLTHDHPKRFSLQLIYLYYQHFSFNKGKSYVTTDGQSTILY